MSSAPAIGVRDRWLPAVGASIDWSHPLAQGLICCVLPRTGPPVDIVGNRPFGATQGTPSLTTSSAWGAAFDCTGVVTQSGWSYAVPAGDPLRDCTNNYSMLCVGDQRAAPNIYSALWGIYPTNSAAAPFAAGNMLSREGTSSIAWATNTTGTYAELALSASSNSRGPFVFTTTVNALALNVRYNGSAATATLASAASALTATPTLVIGHHAGSSSRGAGALISMGCYWRRPLSPAEVGLLHASPFCFLRW